ncbi:sensor protein ZraS [bacterium BMS3Bbin04]|nr:sensor protein ZraS [bacterium BMS3Bbin04]
MADPDPQQNAASGSASSATQTSFFKLMVLPLKWLKRADRIEDLRRYRKLWWYTVTLTVFVAYLPLFVMTGVNYYMYRKNVVAEMQYDISRSLTNVSRSLQFVIEERLSALDLIIRENTNEELSDHEHLSITLHNLKESFGGFVDLGLIDQNGSQVAYVGPYELEGVDYQDQRSFQQAVIRGSFVTEVFMGHRNVPHFAITVKSPSATRNFHVLRATIDVEMMNRMVFVQSLDRADDTFVINLEGVLQTPSQHHGDLLQLASIEVPRYSPNAEVIEYNGSEVDVLGYSYIEDTPFILMMTKRRGEMFEQWILDQTELIVFLILSEILILMVVLWSSTRMVRQIRAGDQRRTKMLMNVEYTNKMATIGRLAASVAHEINNPLAIINEQAGLLSDYLHSADDFPYRDKSKKALESIIRSVERGGGVTHRLLAFTRKMDSRYEPIDICHLLSEVASFLEKEASHRNIRVYKDFTENVTHIESDRGQLQQVFLNVLNNAFAAMENGGKVRIGVEQHDTNSIYVSIQDSGQGISEENLEHIFEPFFSTKGDFGTGLGLSITYGIVQKLGGQIGVHSELGVGTIFSFVFPTTAPKKRSEV